MTQEHALLQGLRVLDCSLWQPGQYAAQLLCDLGADVIKIESPEGDRMRVMEDRFFTVNSNKHSVVADLKTPEGLQRVRDLARDADVLVECFRPGVADRLGIGFQELRSINPSLVYCSISGYGQTGPLADQIGHDHNFQAVAGSLGVVEGTPKAADVLIADQGSGMAAAFAILAAVLCAQRTGEGEHIDVAMTDVVASWVAPMGSIDPSRSSPVVGSPAGYGIFATADGHVVLGVFSEDHLWTEAANALGLDDVAALSFSERSPRSVELNDRIAEKMKARGRDELVADLGARGVPISPVLNREEMMEHAQFKERGLFVTAPDGTRALAHPVRYLVHPVVQPGLPPALGEHDGGWNS